jgi:hypothetical protein
VSSTTAATRAAAAAHRAHPAAGGRAGERPRRGRVHARRGVRRPGGGRVHGSGRFAGGGDAAAGQRARAGGHRRGGGRCQRPRICRRRWRPTDASPAASWRCPSASVPSAAAWCWPRAGWAAACSVTTIWCCCAWSARSSARLGRRPGAHGGAPDQEMMVEALAALSGLRRSGVPTVDPLALRLLSRTGRRLGLSLLRDPPAAVRRGASRHGHGPAGSRRAPEARAPWTWTSAITSTVIPSAPWTCSGPWWKCPSCRPSSATTTSAWTAAAIPRAGGATPSRSGRGSWPWWTLSSPWSGRGPGARACPWPRPPMSSSAMPAPSSTITWWPPSWGSCRRKGCWLNRSSRDRSASGQRR